MHRQMWGSFGLLCLSAGMQQFILVIREIWRQDDDNDDDDRIERNNVRFCTISSLHCELFPTRTHKWPRRNSVQTTSNTWGAHHMQHVVCHVVQRDSSAIEFWQSLNRIYFSFVSLAETINWWRGGNRSTRRNPWGWTSERQDSNRWLLSYHRLAPHSDLQSSMQANTWGFSQVFCTHCLITVELPWVCEV